MNSFRIETPIFYSFITLFFFTPFHFYDITQHKANTQFTNLTQLWWKKGSYGELGQQEGGPQTHQMETEISKLHKNLTWLKSKT